jgi:GTP-binding protein
MSKAIVAIVGRPNVGKSALFNRIVGRPVAIVEDVTGTTRDRLYADAEWQGREFAVVDTGGVQLVWSEAAVEASATPEGLIEDVRLQAEVAIDEADAILFLVDAMAGLTVADDEVAQLLRRADKPVVLVANKADNDRFRLAALDFYSMGLGDPYPVSALHGTGTGDMLDAVVTALPVEEKEEGEAGVKVAIVGRPNVGKSSLLNALLGEARVIVSEVPGTTRDAIDIVMNWEGQALALIDTAGIRRRGRIDRGIEKYSVLRALRAIGRADVVLLLLDATDMVTAQDAHVAGYILDESKSVVVLVNKWDLIEKDTHTMVEFTDRIRSELKFLAYVPVLFISAKTRQRVHQVLPTALKVNEQRSLRIGTSELNQILQSAVMRHAPPSKAGKRLKFLYASQVAVDPPTFVFFVNDERLVHFSYERYLENCLRERYEFLGTPLRLSFRKRKRGVS